MRSPLSAALLAATLLLPLSACMEDRGSDELPLPQVVTEDAVGHYCGMTLVDHPGPKGQIILKGSDRPVWMSSVRDTFAFTMLPEEPKDVRAIYVTDLGRAADPANPDLTAWVEARKAWYVLGSRFRGGMGASEPAPFADEAAAQSFAASHGGRVVRFAEVPDTAILWPEAEPAATADDGGMKHGAHPTPGAS
ncbi:copper resistance protein CopZ [Azospirillum sp. RWY-5-1]|uniref:Copper resistance protein CopZ n=1 Tax=Azospirillum oleiclasticum TaxID=2735135 RepID=A0ABX2T9Q9_9PROT|nr:nitrous oxide reductase accessory protein NosL [Azospirillum oleiclasticum]NYZ13711.1 copper resistance protein CopZ [Azospirillum oleiclasticum]NYZ20983.1 copper resistance protein CopZ [Azospirillum oleiclasticum]